MEPAMQKVITYSSPSGESIDLTLEQIETLENAGVWPRDWQGQEYCQVSHGLHWVSPAMSPLQFNRLLRNLLPKQKEPGTGIITWSEASDGQGQLILLWTADDGTTTREVIEWNGLAPHEPGAESADFANAFGGFDSCELDGDFVHVANN